MNKRKNFKVMMDAVQEGASFTLRRKGEPIAMVLPWADWQALKGELAALEEKLLPPSARRLSDPHARIPEDLWGQGDVAEKVLVDPEESGVRIVTPEQYIRMHEPAVLATDADEQCLQQAYGMTSEQLADEAERGYDPARMVHHRRLTEPEPTDDDEGDFLTPGKIR